MSTSVYVLVSFLGKTNGIDGFKHILTDYYTKEIPFPCFVFISNIIHIDIYLYIRSQAVFGSYAIPNQIIWSGTW